MSEDIDKEAREIALKKAVELMRSGATLLSEVCPICKSPLLKLRSGEVVCPLHGKVMIVKTEEEIAEAGVLSTLVELEKRVSRVLVMHIKKIDKGEISYEDARDIVYWLDALERVERIKQMLRHQPMYIAEGKAEKKSKREEE
ncbi:MAG: Sjogren's syndrome/scleroderma autoantigen 1 family protein [Ignisphaera sp.]|uniref:Uncharacterized protein n=1 Tax=Ignisphaera aggregans TaxID=334771 RepID=A0A7C4NQS9_9CREN